MVRISMLKSFWWVNVCGMSLDSRVCV
jgi:hypothetical protein